MIGVEVTGSDFKGSESSDANSLASVERISNGGKDCLNNISAFFFPFVRVGETNQIEEFLEYFTSRACHRCDDRPT